MQKYSSKHAKLTSNHFLEGERRNYQYETPLREYDELTWPTPTDRNHQL